MKHSIRIVLVLGLSHSCLFAGAMPGYVFKVPSPEAIAAAAEISASYPDVEGFPKVSFNPLRPLPPPGGNVRDFETLTNAPAGLVMPQRRNNFYARDENGNNAPGTGLYRWASSGHFTNYDETQAGMFKQVPDPLVLNNGQPVLDAETWWRVRRPEIVEIIETEMFGKVPPNLPEIEWTSAKTENSDGTVTTVAVGNYINTDGSEFIDPSPARGGRGFGGGAIGGRGFGRGGRGGIAGPTGDIAITYTIPANAPGAVPLVQGGVAERVFEMGFGTVNFSGSAPDISTGRPDDWGTIRKNAWVLSRSLDFLETDPTVDAHQVALTGHSIGGKNALLRGALDQRVGLVFASCSGEAGASLMRRDWGETIDDLAQLSPQNYSQNFQKWVGKWQTMPFDAHMFIALMAPRPVFVTGGTDDQWSDPVGVFWAAHFADPVYQLLGADGLGTSELPEPNTFVGKELVFYNHIGGHITTAEERDKYHEMIQKFFKVVPFEEAE